MKYKPSYLFCFVFSSFFKKVFGGHMSFIYERTGGGGGNGTPVLDFW